MQFNQTIEHPDMVLYAIGGSYSRGPLCLAEDQQPEVAGAVSSTAESVNMHQVVPAAYPHDM